MASRRYLNFDLLLEQEGEGRYQARVTDSPLGETPSVRFQLPFDATTLENLLLKLDPGRSGTRRVGATGQQQAAMDFGGPLYQAVFTGDLALAWQRSLDRARAEQAGGLRLRLRLNDAPAIAGLPWELLYDARTNNFLAQSERTPVVRFLDVPQVPRPIAVDGPLRVLAIISSPVDLEELDVEAEWRRIGEALAPRVQAGLVVIDRLPSATIGDLGTWLRKHQTHVIHFVGHGDFDDQLREGVIYFQDKHGRSSPVTSSILGPYLRDHDPLRMVVLNACRSARTDAIDPFGGMAQGLVQQDATAVVAMQFPISDRAAVTFTGEFYGALVDGLPVDQAVSSARKSLLADFRDEWSTPVLFMRSPDGNIFENVHAVPDAAPGSTDVPPPAPSPLLPKPPGPSLWKSLSLFVSRHRALVAGVLAAVLGLIVLAVIFLPDDDGRSDRNAQDPTDTGGTGTTSEPSTPDPTTDPSPIGEGALPQSEPLPDGQMLVAAGDSLVGLKIWLVDVVDASQTHQVSVSSRKEWLPVLGQDRDTMVYSRLKSGAQNEFELRAATPDTGDGNRALLDTAFEECENHAGRPAWSQVGEPEDWFFVLRCRAQAGDPFRLLKIDMQGGTERLVVDNPATDRPWRKMGDPTISPDGNQVVVFVTDDEDDEAGSLYVYDLAEDASFPLLERAPEIPNQYSDAVFSPGGTMIAFRKTVANGNFDIWTALLNGHDLLSTTPLVESGSVEEDPSFSPDGSEVVFTSRTPGETDTILRRIAIVPGATPVDIAVPADFPVVAKVPAWSIR